jgi:hypothetical protein
MSPPVTDGTVVDQPFSRRALGWIVGLAAASFAAALAFAIFGIGQEQSSAGGDSYSRSALGHRGFVDLLTDEGIQVVRSQHDSARRAGAHSVLLVAEPRLGSEEQKQALGAFVGEAAHVVLVLPKRSGFRDPEHRGWIEETELLPASDADDVLGALDIEAKVVRPAVSTSRFESQLAESFPVGAELHDPQLLAPDAKLRPLVYSAEGILVGRYDLDDDGGTSIIVVADPDLIANHGLAHGENAAIALAAIQALRPPGAVVVVDETLHGHIATPSLWRELFTFPLSLATASALLALALLLWSAMGRFGKPRPAPRALEAGKRSLIDNTAELTRHGGHAAHALERYLHAALHDAARASHAPAQLGPAELREWLQQAARARHVTTDLNALEREVAELSALPGNRPGTAARALAVASRIHRFRQEMIDGSAGHSRAS